MVLLPIHITAGILGIISGFVAIFVFKGAKVHRKSGMIFVYAMLVMSTSGFVMALVYGQPVNIVAAALTFYLVSTALLTVRRPAAGALWMDLGAMFVALAVAMGCVYFFGMAALSGAADNADADFAPIYLVFGVVALLAAIGDARVLRARNIQWKQRLTRHLWRMGLALFIAAGSFFLGNAQVFPEPLRSSGLLGLPVLLVVVMTFFWLARVSFTRWQPRAI